MVTSLQYIENLKFLVKFSSKKAVIAQLGERQTEDLKVPGSIPGRGIFFFFNFLSYFQSLSDTANLFPI